jgi:NADH-quinone oxidoreductase subunit K
MSVYINLKNSIDMFTSISLIDCLFLNLCVFVLSFFGIYMNRKNFLIVLLCLELIFFSISLNFIMFSFFYGNPIGYVYSFIIITITAGETGIGLSLFIVYYRLTGKVALDNLVVMRG